MTLTITLSDTIAQIVQSRVASGAFPNPEAVIEAAIIESQDWESKIESWMQEAVLPTHALNQADPSRALSHDETFAELRRHITSASKAKAA